MDIFTPDTETCPDALVFTARIVAIQKNLTRKEKLVLKEQGFFIVHSVVSQCSNVRLYTHLHTHLHICMHTHLHPCEHAHTHLHAYIHTHTHTHTHTRTWIRTHIVYVQLNLIILLFII